MNLNLQIVIGFAMFACVLCEITPEEIEKIGAKCLKKTGATEVDLKLLDDITTMPSSQTQYCLIACFYKESGMMDASNKFVLAKSLEEVESLKDDDLEAYNKSVAAIKECHKTVAPVADECDSAKVFLQCVAKGIQ